MLSPPEPSSVLSLLLKATQKVPVETPVRTTQETTQKTTQKTTQERIVRFFRDTLGYAYLGFWKERPDNGNVEEEYLA